MHDPALLRRYGIIEIAERKRDFDAALKLYFSSLSPTFGDRFFGYSDERVSEELRDRLKEVDRNSALVALAALEAAFRVDYVQRCEQRKKDPLSRAARQLYVRKKERVSFEEEILALWKEHSTLSASEIGFIKGAFKYRHWLAHGRHWPPKFGQAYDFKVVYSLVGDILSKIAMEIS